MARLTTVKSEKYEDSEIFEMEEMKLNIFAGRDLYAHIMISPVSYERDFYN